VLSHQPHLREELANSARRDALERAENERRAAVAREGRTSLLGRGMAALISLPSTLLRRKPHPVSPRYSVVELAGDLDVDAATDARSRLAAASERQPDEIVIDLAELTSVDPAGIDMLVDAALEMKDRPVRFKHARPEIDALLEDAGLYDSVSPVAGRRPPARGL